MDNNTLRKVVILGVIAIAGIIALQSYWVSKSWSQADEDFDQDVKIALLNVAHKMADYNGINLPITNVVKRVHSNYYVVNFNNIIDANLLEHYLLTQFDSMAVQSAFEYAIYDCGSDEMVYGNYCNIDDNTQTKIQLQSLPKYDEFLYYFGVKFPNRSTYILGDIWLAIVFSVITLIALIFFAYSIFVMLRQKRLSELQRDFINNMTHEFKTPLSSIKISAEMFSNHPTIKEDPRLSQYANIILSQNERLNDQVEKVLNIARIGSEKFNLVLEKVKLHDLLKEIGESKEPEILQLGGRIEYDLNAKKDIITADPLHLKNVIYNLIDNAIKYSPDEVVIKIVTQTSVNGLELSIVDKGMGVLPEHQKQMFNRFYRVPTGNVHNVKGFGLGLYYVKKIIELHHWKIRVESELQRRTSMILSIPTIN